MYKDCERKFGPRFPIEFLASQEYRARLAYRLFILILHSKFIEFRSELQRTIESFIEYVNSSFLNYNRCHFGRKLLLLSLFREHRWQFWAYHSKLVLQLTHTFDASVGDCWFIVIRYVVPVAAFRLAYFVQTWRLCRCRNGAKLRRNCQFKANVRNEIYLTPFFRNFTSTQNNTMNAKIK